MHQCLVAHLLSCFRNAGNDVLQVVVVVLEESSEFRLLCRWAPSSTVPITQVCHLDQFIITAVSCHGAAGLLYTWLIYLMSNVLFIDESPECRHRRRKQPKRGRARDRGGPQEPKSPIGSAANDAG